MNIMKYYTISKSISFTVVAAKFSAFPLCLLTCTSSSTTPCTFTTTSDQLCTGFEATGRVVHTGDHFLSVFNVQPYPSIRALTMSEKRAMPISESS